MYYLSNYLADYLVYYLVDYLVNIIQKYKNNNYLLDNADRIMSNILSRPSLFQNTICVLLTKYLVLYSSGLCLVK